MNNRALFFCTTLKCETNKWNEVNGMNFVYNL
jgi:hypothetical protein